MHPGIEEIGYHNRQYFVGQWERFKDHPWGELAHSTHLRGLGDYDYPHLHVELRVNNIPQDPSAYWDRFRR